MFFRDFALWIWLEKKDRNTGQCWTSLGPSWLWVEFQPPGFIIRDLCYSQATFEEGIEERVFGQRAVWSKAMGTTQGKMKHEWLLVSLLYQFLGVSTPENKYMEIVKTLVVPLAPDSPVDNQFAYTSLSPELIKLCDSPRFFLLGKVDMAPSC